jgi:alpha-tubulin suppressor-like RCC1 family protein
MRQEQRTGLVGRPGLALRALVTAGVLIGCLWCCAAAGAVQIAAGWGQACVVMSSGHIDCWGENHSGQLGDGSDAASDIPVEVEGVGDAIAVSVGGADSCAVLSSGHVDCWGYDGNGELGNGPGANSDIPVEVPGIVNAVQVAVGVEDACVVLSSGHVECWGTEVVEHFTFERERPVEVPGIDDATQVSVSRWDTCALLSSGHIDCWQEGEFGQLGDGSRAASKVPVEVQAITTATQVTTGEEYACALLASGHVSCWGRNDGGQLGDGTTVGPDHCEQSGEVACSDTPVEVQGLVDVTEIGASGSDSCALLSTGHIDCWGGNLYGQLGNGTIEGSDTPVEVLGLAGATQVAAGREYSCALLSETHAACWGRNDDDQLGDGTDGGSLSTPIGVQTVLDATQVAVGFEDACAVRSTGQVDCWGDNENGQLGDASTEREVQPVEVRGISDPVQVSAGRGDSCALLSSGHVECWGGYARAETPVEVKGLTNASQIGTTRSGACALLSSSHVECWGDNEEGQLGDGTVSSGSPTPIEVQGVTDATQVAAGDRHSCAVLSNGRVDCWGDNEEGQLGDGGGGGGAYSPAPVEAKGLTDATHVAVGNNHSCAVLSSGHVYCWGDNEEGQLGYGRNPEGCEESADVCDETPHEVSGINSATQIAAGGSDSCALLSSGHVDCWGANQSGQLGNGAALGPEGCDGCRSATPVEVQGLGNATEIGVGADEDGGSACAVLSSGDVDCWGSNSSDALGDGLAWSTVPIDVIGLTALLPSGGSSDVAEASTSAESTPGASSGSGTQPSEQASLQGVGSESGASAHTSLLSFSAIATSKGKLSLKLSCHDTSTCTGIVSIVVIEYVKRHGSRRVVLASARYTLRAASSADVTMTLDSHARALLRRGPTLHAIVRITTTVGAMHTRSTSRLVIHAARR